MKLIKSLGVLLATTTLFAITVGAATNAPVVTETPTLGLWTLSISGGGSTSLTGDKNSVVGGEFALGHSGEFVLPMEVGVRQNVGWSDSDGSSWLFSTKAFVDWTVLKLGNLEFDAGGNVGMLYGNRTPVWVAAPEVVARLYLKTDVDVFARVEYPFNLNDGKTDESLVYSLGLRVRF